jgi:uncharacterized surface protein with fasciclin (FAS1) repeats
MPSLSRTSRRYLRTATETSQDLRAFLDENPAVAAGLASFGNLLLNAVKKSEYAPVLQPFLDAAARSTASKKEEVGKDIVDTALEAGGFETLASALRATGLVDALKADGPFTVFAPTDEAFAGLPEGALDDLLKPENQEKLKSILLYHVVAGRIPVDSMRRSVRPTTLQGDALRVKARRGGVRVNGAQVVTADVSASNGIIHAIDAVLLPAEA